MKKVLALSLTSLLIGSAPGQAQFASTPPLGERKFLKSNLVVIETAIGNGSGSIIGKNGNAYIVLTSKHVVDKIEKAEEIDITTGDGKMHTGSIVAKSSNSDIALASFKANDCYAESYLGYETVFWMNEMTPQKQPKRMIVAGVTAVDPTICKKPIIRSAVASLAVKIETEDTIDGYQYGYDAPTARGMSGGALLTDSYAVTGGSICMGNCNQPFGYHLGVHGRGERDSSRGDAKTGYNFAVPSAKAILLMAKANLLSALNIDTLYVAQSPDKQINNQALEDTNSYRSFKLDTQSCKPKGLTPVTFSDNSQNDLLVQEVKRQAGK